MHIAMNAGIYKKGVTASTFSGTFSTTASTANISSPTRTYTLGTGNSGQIRFASLVNPGASSFYSINGGTLTAFADNDVITLANTDTLLVRITGLPAASSATFNLVDVDTGTTIEAVSITRT